MSTTVEHLGIMLEHYETIKSNDQSSATFFEDSEAETKAFAKMFSEAPVSDHHLCLFIAVQLLQRKDKIIHILGEIAAKEQKSNNHARQRLLVQRKAARRLQCKALQKAYDVVQKAQAVQKSLEEWFDMAGADLESPSPKNTTKLTSANSDPSRAESTPPNRPKTKRMILKARRTPITKASRAQGNANQHIVSTEESSENEESASTEETESGDESETWEDGEPVEDHDAQEHCGCTTCSGRHDCFLSFLTKEEYLKLVMRNYPVVPKVNAPSFPTALDSVD
jgi:hypothetical protein